MRWPRSISSGRVGVFAPSSPFTEERFVPGVKALESLGYSVHIPEAARLRQGYLAGSDEARLAAFHALLTDPSIDVIMAARGGYGLHRIVDRIDPAALRASTQAIVGFSDITALHLLCQREGLSSVHGPVITQLGELPPEAHQALALTLAGRAEEVEYRATAEAIRPGVAEGRLLGGCLSVITPLLGSSLLPSMEGAILLLEDVGEATYRIDRMLTHLHLAGVLGQVRGVALGEFVGCNPRSAEEPSVEEVLHERFSKLGVPVLSGLPFGHGRRNLAAPLGAPVVLDATAGTLRVLPRN